MSERLSGEDSLRKAEVRVCVADEGGGPGHGRLAARLKFPAGGEAQGHEQLEGGAARGDGQPGRGDRAADRDKVPAPVQHRADPAPPEGDHGLSDSEGGEEGWGQSEGPGGGQPREGSRRGEVPTDEDERPLGAGEAVSPPLFLSTLTIKGIVTSNSYTSLSFPP